MGISDISDQFKTIIQEIISVIDVFIDKVEKLSIDIQDLLNKSLQFIVNMMDNIINNPQIIEVIYIISIISPVLLLLKNYLLSI